MVMKIAAVRGVESHGMMCSEQELELAETSDGIIELPDEAPVGTDFAIYAGLDDPILDVEITPTRSEEHTSELQSLMRSSYAVFCLKKKKHRNTLAHE